MNRVYCFGFSSPEGDAILENRRAKVELYEQIRREYEHGGGTIRAVARKLGVHRREVRKALASAMPPERKIPERERPKLAAAIPFIEAVLEADRKRPESSGTRRTASGCDCAARCLRWQWRNRRCASTCASERSRWDCWDWKPSCHSPTPGAARRKWTGMKAGWSSTASCARRTCSACAVWPAGAHFIGLIRTPTSKRFWKRTNWRSPISGVCSACCVTTT